MQAKKLNRRANYTPIAGAEHCPACWVGFGKITTLRTESHHNGDRVQVVVCDGCGLFEVC